MPERFALSRNDHVSGGERREDGLKRAMSESGWSLHPQLEHDTVRIGDLALCRVLAIDDAIFPWLLLVPRRSGAVEIFDLADADAARLTEEIAVVSRVLKHITRCDKLNVAAIGNVVPQLHVHVVARWKTDPLWPRPVWGHMTPAPGDAAGFGRFVAAVRSGLEFALPLPAVRGEVE